MNRYAALIPAVLLLLLNGCEKLTPEQQARQLAPLVVRQIRAQIGGDVSGIEDVQPPLGRVEVYIDRSLTLQPYDRSPGSVLGRMIGHFDDFISSEITFYGFGYPASADTAQEVARLSPRQLYAADTYGYANNDYADLFGRFHPDGGTRLVITDGVQSDPDSHAQLAAVADQLHRWVTSGGAFAALLYRNPYSGRYYSDLEGEDPLYDCGDRPFVVFVLAPSSRAVDDLLERLAGGGLRPQHVVRMGGNDLAIRPMPEVEPDSGDRRGLRVARGIDETFVRGFKPIPSAVVVDRAGRDSDGYVPLQFQAALSLREHPWQSLGVQGSERFIHLLRPQVHGWRYDRRALARGARPDTAGAEPLLHPVELDARQARFTRVWRDGDSIRARFTVPVRRPEGREHDFAFLVTLRPGEEGAFALVPDAYSTEDDRSPAACGRVLKLRRLLSGIVLRNYVPGRTLFVADWR